MKHIKSYVSLWYTKCQRSSHLESTTHPCPCAHLKQLKKLSRLAFEASQQPPEVIEAVNTAIEQILHEQQ